MRRVSRRGFLWRLVATSAAVLLAKKKQRPRLTIDRLSQPISAMVDTQLGVSIRFIQHYDIAKDRGVSRSDVIRCGSIISSVDQRQTGGEA